MLLTTLIAIGVGLALGLGWWWTYRSLAVALGKALLRPSKRNPGQGWLRSTSFVLSGQLPLALWIGLLIPAPVAHVGLSFFIPAGIAVFGGILGMSGLLLEVVTEKKKITAVERALLPLAVERLLAYASVDYATRVLEYTLHSPDSVFRLAAARGLGTLGTDQALKLLAKVANDPDPAVRTAASRGSDSIRKALGEGHALSVKNMPTLFKEHEQLSQQLDHLSAHDFKTAARKLIEIEHTMTEVVNSQIALRNAYPDLWCARCQARTTESRYARWRYVHCRRCEDATDLRLNIRKVTGLIGPPENPPIDKRELIISLWAPEEAQARFAEIDLLEIHPAPKIDLNQAIQAVVATLNQHWPDRKTPIDIKISGNPPLSEQSLASLRTLKPSFQTGA